jgi:uncharacterized protein (TIGR03437 family)
MLWPTLRADPSLATSDEQTIDNWITGLISPRPMGGWFPDDLGYWQQEVNMADAIRRSDDAGFAQGIATYFGALQQMRADGSFPLAAQLSACSSVYSNADLTHLVSIAEMAASQGYNLYSMSFNGNTLDTAISFMLDAYANPDLLWQYSKLGGGICFEGKPGDPPDFSFFQNPNGSLSWMEPYIARFPLSMTAARLRKILGSNIGAAPFPLMDARSGLNTTGAFRKPYEFQPFNGAHVTVVSGDSQTATINQPAPNPLTVRVTDDSGKALAGALVSFAVTGGSAMITAPAQILTDPTGMASANVAIGPGSGPVTVTAAALGVRARFSLAVAGVAIYPGGVGGIGASIPAVTAISPGALFSIYGQEFVAAGAGRRVDPSEIVNGMLPSNLLGVCVSVGGISAPLLDVYPGQINAVAPAVTPGSPVAVVVTTGCGTSNPVQSVPQFVLVAAATPEFLYFAHNANGQNPVAAVNAVTGAYVGPASLGNGYAPAHSGDVVTIYASGFGPTNPPIAPGAVASGQAQVTNPVTVTIGSTVLDASDILYAGAAPGEPICQLNIRIPSGIPVGNQPVQIQIGGLASPPGAFLALAAP